MALYGVAIGLGLGIVNGLLVTVGKIPAIIATIGTLAIYRGLLFEITNGQNVTADQLPDRILDLAAKKPFGLPTLAWIALGVPVISTRTMGIPELVEHGESGLLVAPGDLDGLTDALRSLLEDEGLRARLATRARDAVERGYDLARTIPQLRAVYASYLEAA